MNKANINNYFGESEKGICKYLIHLAKLKISIAMPHYSSPREVLHFEQTAFLFFSFCCCCHFRLLVCLAGC